MTAAAENVSPLQPRRRTVGRSVRFPAPGQRTESAGSTFGSGSLVVACWILSLTCMSPSGREDQLALSSFDSIAMLKVVSRAAVMALLGLGLVKARMTTPTRRVFPRLYCWGMLAAWAILSAVWSPLKVVTLGHALELAMFVALAALAALVCKDEKQLRVLLFHLTAAAATLAAVVLLSEDSLIIGSGRPRNFVHPNTLAAVAGLGLTLLFASRILWGWRWSRWAVAPGSVLFVYALLLAHSRASILVTAAVLSVFFWFNARHAYLCVGLTLLASFAALQVVAGTGADLWDMTSSYLLRGQSHAEFLTLTGRTELWTIAVASYLEAPLFGHGYFVMSETGKVDVWNRFGFMAAHNAYLHLLLGAGLVGILLLFWGSLGLARCVKRLRGIANGARKGGILATTVIAWCFASGLTDLSFLGPVSSVPAMFFCMLGISSGYRTDPRPQAAQTVVGPRYQHRSVARQVRGRARRYASAGQTRLHPHGAITSERESTDSS